MNQRLKETVLGFQPDLPEEIVERLRKIKILLVDVDGVLTDGAILFSDQEYESKNFSTRDGLILGRIRKFGVLTGAISGRKSLATEARLKALKFDEVMLGYLAKWPVVQEILEKHGLKPDEAAFIGDDLVDLPALLRVGISAVPSDAHPALIGGVDLVLDTPGGYGCVREFLDLWLSATGQWEKFVNSFEAHES
ncbi:MAG: hypothetical protein IPG71_06050 [bacterium]|nr:hypothetical protein [bacterium]